MPAPCVHRRTLRSRVRARREQHVQRRKRRDGCVSENCRMAREPRGDRLDVEAREFLRCHRRARLHHTTRHEVAAPPQVPTPERRPQLSIISEEMMRGLPLNRLHYTTRCEMGWDTQQQMDMVGPHVLLQNLDVLTPTDFPDQVPHRVPDLLRPVVVRSRSVGSLSATVESKPGRVLPQCCLRFQRWHNLDEDRGSDVAEALARGYQEAGYQGAMRRAGKAVARRNSDPFYESSCESATVMRTTRTSIIDRPPGHAVKQSAPVVVVSRPKSTHLPDNRNQRESYRVHAPPYTRVL
jgi:hypothetical protein